MMVSTSGPIKPLPPEVRSKALKLLRFKGHLALSEIERLTGWESPTGMTNHVMAQQLGITERQFKYLLWRHDLREKEKERRLAERDAKNVAVATHTSHKLGFSILLPANWRVITDALEWSRLANEYLQHLLHSKPPEEPTSLPWQTRVEFSESGEPVPRDLKRLAEEELEERLVYAERHAQLEQMATGLFQAEPLDGDDGAFFGSDQIANGQLVGSARPVSAG
ncbi:MAG: hypothetical protein KGL11_11780 [Alphaproteobacteria bacterium]|nr:hypothetical protein [Alphaproteobacteria bacterium]